MSSVSKSLPLNLQSGDCGILAHEPCQRLLSIFIENATDVLNSLYKMASSHSSGKFEKLFSAGLNSIGLWNSEVLQEEVNKMLLAYPESMDLYKFAYLSLLADIQPHVKSVNVPPLDSFYHIFMKRISTSDDMKSPIFFINLPFANKRYVYVESFRNALHDVLRRFAELPLKNIPKYNRLTNFPETSELSVNNVKLLHENSTTGTSEKGCLKPKVSILGESMKDHGVDEDCPSVTSKSKSSDNKTKKIEIKREPSFFESEHDAASRAS